MGSPPTTSVRKPARRNIALACENCRVRKVRCDGLRPACQTCRRRGAACNYTLALGPWEKRRKEYVQDLEEQLRGREPSVCQQHPPSLDEAADSQETSGLNQDWQGASPSTENLSGGPSRLNGSVHVGLSSSGVFLRELYQAVVPSAAPSPPSLTLRDLGTDSSTCNHPTQAGLFDLPPREVADAYLETYWRMCHPVYPAISRIRYTEQFNAMYTGSLATADRRVVHCMANLIFAMAERSMVCPLPSAEHQRPRPRDYFTTAKQLLQFNMFGEHSFSTLQALVLICQYLQSTQKSRQCWTTVGFAITIARSMGLHLAETRGSLKSTSDRFMALVLWNCLVTLDRTLSMTLGRIPTLSLDLARLSSSALLKEVPEGSDVDHSFFIESCRLFDILHDILVSLYNEGPEVAQAADITRHALRLEKVLDTWLIELPATLNDTGANNVTSHGRFLKQRYLQVRIIAMRPGLLRFMNGAASPDTSPWNLEKAAVWYCANQSIDLAIDMAEMATMLVQSSEKTDNATPWWYQVQYCYNSALTLMAARMNENLASGPILEKIDHGIAKCTSVMEECARISPTASGALAMLGAVLQKLDRNMYSRAPSLPQFEAVGGVSAQVFPWGDEWTPFDLDEAIFQQSEPSFWNNMFSTV
ncbi:fungal-specific transcription factor domain-containing protein [Plectosphaerella cucumerina]|uniref:Fungal-specific transcription factor domain-containing protein n=1 Tax=Plectosphaerella cucumerina TaxID=40658 RepID=A0A8K0T913_9PEZI|nr:fungal-specific transcription factor domain-containing protein [Plectosphaerella cucumerina]